MTNLEKARLLFTRSERTQLLLLVGAMAIGAVLETTGVAFIVPFVALISDPGKVMALAEVRPYLDFFRVDSEYSLFVLAGTALLSFYLVRGGYLALMYFVLFRFIFRKRVSIANRLLAQYIEAPLAFHLARNSSELIKNATDTMQRFAMGVMLPMMIAVSEGLVIIALVTFLFIVAPTAMLSLIAVIGLPAALFYGLVRKNLAERGRISEQSLGLVFQWIRQSLGGIKETKLASATQYFVDRHAEQATKFADAYSTMTFLSQVPRMLMEFFAIGGLVLATLVLVDRREIDEAIPYLSMFAVAAIRLMPSGNRLMTSLGNLRFHFSSANIICDELEALERAPADESAADRSLSFTLQHELTLKELSYRYPGSSRPSVDSVSLTIARGSFVAFVGPTAAGKTTIIDIILGLLPPTAGAVLVDGQDIRKNVRGWQRKIGYVPQAGYMSDDTIRRNVAFAVLDAEIDDSRVWAALEAAQLMETVSALPEGLATRTGEEGARLSGGERQRLGIARALYRDPDVLIMDEISASLDSATERKIADTIESLRGKKTILMVAHRMAMIRRCDCLYLLREGRIVARGPYDDLLAGNEEFQKLAM